MQLSVQGRQIDISDGFRERARLNLESIFQKYFGDAIDVNVTISREGHLYRTSIIAHVGRGIQARAVGEAEQPYAALDLATDHLSKRLRRNKRRLRDHHKTAGTPETEQLTAQQYILAGDEDHGEGRSRQIQSKNGDDGRPLVIAEMTTEIPRLTVGQAVLSLDLADLPALLFRNRGHGGLNMIYRRPDGNIGWVDPRGNSDD
jgi:ribosomal subunit interface protein